MATWDNREKPGNTKMFNEPGLPFNANVDPESGLANYFNGLGTIQVITNTPKN